MKKLIALILATLMIFALVACGDAKTDNTDKDPGKEDAKNENNNEEVKLEGVEGPVDILEAVWAKYAEDEMFFAMGGDPAHAVNAAPGEFSLEDKDSLAALLVCKDDAVDMVESAASIMHAMVTNNFTGAVYKVKEGKTDAFVTAMKEAIQGNQWVCGFPEKLLIAEVTDDYVVVAYGVGDIIEVFKTHLVEAYGFVEPTVESIG